MLFPLYIVVIIQSLIYSLAWCLASTGLKQHPRQENFYSMTTRSELVEQLSQRFPQLEQKDTRLVVDSLLTAMTQALSNGQRIEIRGFASFSVGLRKPRTGRNPKTGESVQVPAKQVVRFKPGKEMREDVDY
jgi:integration host factor subunit beta